MVPQWQELRARHPEIGVDYTIGQRWSDYTHVEHAIWRRLYRHMERELPGRACDEFLDGMKRLKIGDGGIPDFRRLSDELYKLTRWQVVAVPSLVPDEVFFEHLANRRFPAARFIRTPGQCSYIAEPDVFHDIFGHVPMLALPVFADFMEAYGREGQRAHTGGALRHLARLYWYTVEFGLIEKPQGLRIYGSGIVSSSAETEYALTDPSPNRIRFALARVMQTDYRIDDFQDSYFVIPSFEALFRETSVDFAPLYERMLAAPSHAPHEILPGDSLRQGC